MHGRTVIPGLIDNHTHFIRAAEYWDREVRLDGVTSHRQALEMIRAKAAQSRSGEWIAVLGGWSEEQFTDEPRGFTKDELDRVEQAADLTLESRLGCQAVVTGDVVVEIPAWNRNYVSEGGGSMNLGEAIPTGKK